MRSDESRQWREKFNNVSMIPPVIGCSLKPVHGGSVDRCTGMVRRNPLSGIDCLTHIRVAGPNPNDPN